MDFITKNNDAIYFTLFNFLISIILITNNQLLFGILVFIITALIFMIQFNKYKKTILNIAKDKDITLKDISLLVNYFPINLTISDKNNNPIASNVKNRTILETLDIKKILDDINIRDNSQNNEKIIKVQIGKKIKQYFTYKRNIKNQIKEIIGYVNIEVEISEILQYYQKIIEHNKNLELLGKPLEIQINNEIETNKQRNLKDLLFNNKDSVLVFAYNPTEHRILNFIDSSGAINNIISYDKQQLKNIDIYNLFHISEKERLATILTNIVNENPILFETLMINGKRTLPVEINAHLCKVYNKNAIYLSIRDITLRKELELKRDRNRILSIKDNKITLILHLLHILFARFGNSIRIIYEKTNNIENTYIESKYETKEIKNALEIIDKTIKDLISFYTPSNIKIYVNIKSIIEQIQKTIFFKEIINNITITAIQKGNVAEIYCDEDAIKYVLITIIGNAIENIEINKGTNFYGEIDISIQELNDNYILISIEDNGGGINDGIIDRVFDMFYSTKTHAAGIGLPTCRVMVEEILSGTIQITNINDGLRVDIQISK